VGCDLALATKATVIEAWFAFASPDFSPKTVKETRGYVDRSRLSTIGNCPLSKLEPAELDAFYRQLRTSGGLGARLFSERTNQARAGVPRRTGASPG
jgi:hypothetical protein